MNVQDTMTPAELAAWEAAPGWFGNLTRAERIRQRYAALAIDGVVPYGTQTRIAREFGCEAKAVSEAVAGMGIAMAAQGRKHCRSCTCGSAQAT